MKKKTGKKTTKLTAAQKNLVESHLWLPKVMLAKRPVQRHFRQELEAYGMLGLVEAAACYKRSVGAAFATYAKYHISKRLIEAVSHYKSRGMMQRGASASRHGAKVARAVAKAHAAGIPEANIDAFVAAATGIRKCTAAAVRTFWATTQFCGTEVLFNRPTSDQEAVAYPMSNAVRRALNDLTIVERRAVQRITDYDGSVSQKDLSKRWGCSRQYVSQIEKSALNKLREALSPHKTELLGA